MTGRGPTASSTPRTSTATPTTAPTHGSSTSAVTVAGAAGALTTLLGQDLQSGAIDQHGQDLLNHLQDILGSSEQTHGSDALHKVDDLVKHVGDLANHGDIRPYALPAIITATGRLRATILRAARLGLVASARWPETADEVDADVLGPERRDACRCKELPQIRSPVRRERVASSGARCALL